MLKSTLQILVGIVLVVQLTGCYFDRDHWHHDNWHHDRPEHHDQQEHHDPGIDVNIHG